MLTGIIGSHYLGGSYGVFTYGTNNAHFSLTGLYSSVLNNGGWHLTRSFTLKDFGAIGISGMKRLTAKFALVTENWASLPDFGIKFLSGGLRLIREKSTWEFGACSVSIAGKYLYRNPKYYNRHYVIAPIPFISYVRNL